MLRPLALLLLLALPAAVPAQENTDPAANETETDERIELVLALQRELRRLLEELPPELRAEAQRRWRDEVATPQEPRPAPEADPETARPPATESTPEPRPEPAPPAPRSAPPPQESGGCDTLIAFDTNADGELTAADRYWRHFRLWQDDGDGMVDKSEVDTLFGFGVRRIGLSLRSYTSRKGVSYDVWLDDPVRFDLPRRNRSAFLMLDADALARGRELLLTDAAGKALSGLQPIGSGVYLAAAAARPSPLRCR